LTKYIGKTDRNNFKLTGIALRKSFNKTYIAATDNNKAKTLKTSLMPQNGNNLFNTGNVFIFI
jgi:hypothetical protein